MKQYIPRNVRIPDLGEVRELVDRQGNLKALGVVYGRLPKEQTVLIRALKLDKDGNITHRKGS